MLNTAHSDFFYSQFVRTFQQELMNGFPKTGMYKTGRNFIQGLQHKPSVRLILGCGNRQTGNIR